MGADDLEKLNAMLSAKSYSALRAEFSEMNSIDVARFIETLSNEQAVVAFRTLHKDMASEVFAEFEPEAQQRVIEAVTDSELSEIVDDLWVDDAVDMLEEMPSHLVKRVLSSASPESRSLINHFLLYPDDSAGSVMTPEFTDLSSDMTVEQAIAHIRSVGENRETVYTCYVIDDLGRLEGVVSVKDLLLADDSATVQDVMSPDVISVFTTSDREKAARLLAKYSLISLPVMDAERHLVGIITVDDAVDVLREETTEDFQKMAAITPSERPYLKTGIFTLARNRLPWLLLLMFSGMLTGSILGMYEPIYAALPILVTFIPMLTGTGGNAGSQASTTVIRGLALGEIKPVDALRVLWQEARVGVVVGVALGAINYVRMTALGGSSSVALVVSSAQFGAIVIAQMLGGLLPLAARAVKVDPAIMAAPMITSVADALTLMIYFTVASTVLS